MFGLIRHRFNSTEGQRARTLAFVLVAIVGLGMGYLTVIRLDKGASFLTGFTGYERWIVCCGGVGAVIGLFLAGDRVGQIGAFNPIRAAAGALWVSFVGSIVAGTLALPLYGTMFGPFNLVIMLATSPVLLLAWATHLMAIHILMGIYQRERDTIFTPHKLGLPERPSDLRRRMVRGIL